MTMNPLDPQEVTSTPTTPVTAAASPGSNESDDALTVGLTVGAATPQEIKSADDRVAAAIEKLNAAAGPSFDVDQRKALLEKLAKLGKSEAKTTSGSEAPAEGPALVADPAAAQAGRPLTGRDVDWSEYNLDYNIAHLYKSAVYRDTPQGPKWVSMVTDFQSSTKDFRQYGKRVNAPGSTDQQETEALNLAEYLNDMINGREQWKIAAVMPAQSGQCGVLLERQVPFILPDPELLKKSEEVEAPTDQALQATEDAALAFMAEQKDVDNGGVVSDDLRGDFVDIGLRPVAAEEAAAIKESLEAGAVEARYGAGVSRAIATAAAETVAAPQAGFEQPEAVAGNDLAVSNANPEGKVAAAGYSAAQELLRALNDPNFRSQLPTEE